MKKNTKDYLVKLNEADKQILSSYCTLCDCLTTYLGNAYEIVVHSLGKGDRYIQKIVNGNFSGRTESDGLNSAAIFPLEQLYAMVMNDDLPITVYFGTDKDGGLVKTASIGIVGSGKKLIGMICLNFHLNTPFSVIIESFALSRHFVASNSQYSAYDAQGFDAALCETIKNAQQVIMNDPDIPSKFKKKEIIRKLNEAGVFKIKNGVGMCAEMLGVTITTIYMHIRKLGLNNDKT